MSDYQTNAVSDTCLRSNADKAAFGWDLDSMENRMSLRLSKIRESKDGSEAHDAKAAPRVSTEKDRIRA